jgi:hypothetical protein
MSLPVDRGDPAAARSLLSSYIGQSVEVLPRQSHHVQTGRGTRDQSWHQAAIVGRKRDDSRLNTASLQFKPDPTENNTLNWTVIRSMPVIALIPTCATFDQTADSVLLVEDRVQTRDTSAVFTFDDEDKGAYGLKGEVELEGCPPAVEEAMGKEAASEFDWSRGNMRYYRKQW